MIARGWNGDDLYPICDCLRSYVELACRLEKCNSEVYLDCENCDNLYVLGYPTEKEEERLKLEGRSELCKHLKKLAEVEDWDDITDKQSEQIKRILCEALCNGICRSEFVE